MATETLQRLPIEPQPEFAKILRVDETYATGDGGGPANWLNRRFDRLIVQSGTGIAPSVVLRLCLLGAIACGGSAFVAFEDLLLTAAAAAMGGFSPIAGLLIVRARRQAKLQWQIPALIDELAHAARNGHSLTRGLESAVAVMPSPLGDEIRLAVRRAELGIGIEDALADLPERTGVPELNVLIESASRPDHQERAILEFAEFANETRRSAREPGHSAVRPFVRSAQPGGPAEF